MDDETRERVREAVVHRIGTRYMKDGSGIEHRLPTISGVVAAILAALDAYGERERKPASDSGGKVEWHSRPDEDGDSVQVSGGRGFVSIGTAGPYAAFVSPSEIPHMARALYQAAGLEWPDDREPESPPDSGGEDGERLKREVDHLRTQLAGCGVAADGGTSDAMVAKRGDFGWSASYQAVLDCRRELDQLRDTLQEAADALGCEPDEVPERVRDVQSMRDRLNRARNELTAGIQEEIRKRREAEQERDEARAEVERLRQRVANLTQAPRQLAPETVALLRAAQKYAWDPGPVLRAQLLARVFDWAPTCRTEDYHDR